MGGCCTSTCHRDVWEGSEVVQCKALFIEILAQVAIANAAANCNGSSFGIYWSNFIEMLSGEKVRIGIGDGVKAVPCSQRPNLAGIANDFSCFINAFWFVNIGCAVRDVACPVLDHGCLG